MAREYWYGVGEDGAHLGVHYQLNYLEQVNYNVPNIGKMPPWGYYPDIDDKKK